MSAIFLSASVPIAGRGSYYESASPFLIQWAVRELVASVIRKRVLVWGGHPAITPMIWTICEDLGVEYARSVVLYQSRFFEAQYPEENLRFSNIVLVDAVEGDRERSLARLRHKMLSRSDLSAAVFIGGMEGVEAEFALYRSLHPAGKVIPVPAAGGAARSLAQRIGMSDAALEDLNFAGLFQRELGLGTDAG